MQPVKQNKALRKPTLFIIIILVLICANIAFLVFSANESNTTSLLRNELVSLEQDKRIIASANEISSKYQQEIEVISNAFPNEETMPQFIEQLENLLKNNTDSYTFKFSSVTPLKEQDRLYLPLTLTLHTDSARLIELLTRFERLSYMTHIGSIVSKTPDGFARIGESSLNIKIYVQNPFTTK